MTPAEASEVIKAHADPKRAVESKAYHKSDRAFWGVPNPILNDLAKEWRQTLSLDERIALASGLWRMGAHESCLTAAKLLTQARIKPDDAAAWDLIQTWVPDFDGWAIADHVCIAGQKRLSAQPNRVDEIEHWTRSDHLWTKRAALVITLAWTKQNNPKPQDLEIRDRVLGWAGQYVADQRWFIQKAVAWWLRDLSKHDPKRVIAFVDTFGDGMKAFARKEAVKYLPNG